MSDVTVNFRESTTVASHANVQQMIPPTVPKLNYWVIETHHGDKIQRTFYHDDVVSAITVVSDKDEEEVEETHGKLALQQSPMSDLWDDDRDGGAYTGMPVVQGPSR